MKNSLHNITGAQKDLARGAAMKAVRTSQLTRPTACESCQATKQLDAHHPDHLQPLAVQWLCRLCHKHQTHNQTDYVFTHAVDIARSVIHA